jgi:hypothetical protein
VKRFACWEEREVAKTLVDDANRDAPAVFSAVHRPSRVLRKDIRRGRRDPGVAVSEHDVLEALLGGELGEDRIVPVVGESGTGKSHLIRWLDANIERSKDLHVVYIEKRGTSLRQVIHRILEGLDRPEVRHRQRFMELRAEVDRAAAGLDRNTARLRLLTELAHAIREHGADVSVGSDELADREELADELPDLLTDREFRVSLLQDGGIIAQTVDRTLGRIDGDGESPIFTELRLDVQDVMRAGASARELRQNLYGDPESLKLAVRMMNEQLNPALAALMGIDRRQIYEVMLEVREALLAEGKTLVLLVEDFALLRGVETQLLDAMIADAESQGERILCPMRSALAVTTGYFEGKESALTRIHSRGGYIYSLDAELGNSETEVGPSEVEAFVATYLNAARVGRERLEATFARRSTENSRDRSWVDNACSECPFHEECHQAFGEAEGYGLYPFNGSALSRIINSQTEAFDPRHILQIMDTTLRGQRQALVGGRFPDPDWAAQYDEQQVTGRPELPYLPSAVATTYEQMDPGTAARRKTLVTFWGGVPGEAVNLRETIHEAFDLPLLAGLPLISGTSAGGDKPEVVYDREHPGADRPGPKPARVRSSDLPAQSRENRALDVWGHGGELEQSLANNVRKALATAVRGAREWSCFGVDPGALNRQIANSAFSLGPNAKGEGSGASDALGVLEPSDANAFLLQGVLQAQQQGDWDFERGFERLVTFSEFVDDWADQALKRLRPASEAVSAIAQILLLGGAALGIAGPADTDERLLEAMFADPLLATSDGDAQWVAFQQELLRGPSAGASRQELMTMLLKSAQLRRALGQSYNLIAIDSAPLIQAISNLRRSGWNVPKTEGVVGLDRSVHRHAEGLRHSLVQTVRQRLRTLAARRSVALELLGGTRDQGRIADDVERAYTTARATGVADPEVSVDISELEARFRAADLSALDRLKGLDTVDDLKWPKALDVLVAASREQLEPIDEYLGWADRTLSVAQGRVRVALGGRPDAGGGVAATSAEVAVILRNLATELGAIPR